MPDNKRQLITLFALLHKHLKGKDADENAIIEKTLNALVALIPKKEEIVSDVLAAIPAPKEGEPGAPGPSGAPGEAGHTPTDEELMALIMPLIPEVTVPTKEEIRDIVIQLLPQSVEDTGEVPDTVIFYIQTVVNALRSQIASKTYDASEIVGLADFIAENGTGAGFEYISKNISNYDTTFAYSGGDLSTITYAAPGGDIIKTFSYSGGDVSTIVLSGNVPASVTETTKTFSYSGGNVSGYVYS